MSRESTALLWRVVAPLVQILSAENEEMKKKLEELEAANHALLQRVEDAEARMIYLTPPALRPLSVT